MPEPGCDTGGPTSMKLSQSMREQDSAAVAPRRVLVVEDEFLIRMIVCEELRECGYQVIEAANADEAVVILQASPLDLIISDVKMPGSIDGLGLLAVVKDSLPELPVILISGHLEPAQAIKFGAARFLRKPFSMDEIADAVKSELEKLV